MTATVLERPILIDFPRPTLPVELPRLRRLRPGTPAGVLGEEPSGGRAGRRRTAMFALAGVAPVLAVPAQVLGVLPLAVSVLTAVLPLAVVALVALLSRVGGRDDTGMLAGLVSAAACYAVALPLTAAGIWPDLAPGLGATADAALSSLWSYVGSGGGAGMFGFMLVGLPLTFRPHLVNRRTVAAGVGYLLFVLTGLVAATMLPGGLETPVSLSPTGFLVHLAYAAVLGFGLPIAVRRISTRRAAL